MHVCMHIGNGYRELYDSSIKMTDDLMYVYTYSYSFSYIAIFMANTRARILLRYTIIYIGQNNYRATFDIATS